MTCLPAAAASIALVALAGCGGNSPHKAPSIESVRRCLKAAGLNSIGGTGGSTQVSSTGQGPTRTTIAAPAPGAPIGELITTGTFIAFYSNQADANRAKPSVARNAARLHGSITRHGNITVIYLYPTDTNRKKVERCVEDS
ncbi:MAG: hypothetical protein E6G56_07345 [Actinobacteria bacterium]|nr:MAG: hypothetical protein E6G56_07345 [Actinomycetota bacterium]